MGKSIKRKAKSVKVQEKKIKKEEIVIQEVTASPVSDVPVEIPMGIPKKKPNTFFVWFGTAAVGVILIGSTFYFYSQYQKTSSLLAKPVAQNTASQVIAKVGSLMVLPREKPTLATVSDVTKLANQPFFAQAQNGDEVLIYSTAGKAILYRPSINKIINVAPLNVGSTAQASSPQVAGAQTTASASATSTPTPAPMNVVLYNGTSTVGLTKAVRKVLAQKLPTAKVVSAINAKKDTYTATIVIDLAGTRATDAQTLATAIGATVGPLPTGEAKPATADFLIIVGSDYAGK